MDFKLPWEPSHLLSGVIQEASLRVTWKEAEKSAFPESDCCTFWTQATFHGDVRDTSICARSQISGRLSGELSAGVRTEGPQMADGSGCHLMGAALGARGVGVAETAPCEGHRGSSSSNLGKF